MKVDITKILAIGFLVVLGVSAVSIPVLILSDISMNEITAVVELNNSSVYVEDNKFFIIGPNGIPIEFDPEGDTIDFTKHSIVYAKFTKQKPSFLFSGTDWAFDGIVKIDE